MARKKEHFETGVCPFCQATTHYDGRAGRMPMACEKDKCKLAARKQGRRPIQWKQAIKNGGVR